MRRKKPMGFLDRLLGREKKPTDESSGDAPMRHEGGMHEGGMQEGGGMGEDRPMAPEDQPQEGMEPPAERSDN
jgi:hypothetical protein